MYIQTVDSFKISVGEIIIRKQWFCSFQRDSPSILGLMIMLTKELVRSLFGNWSFPIFANLKKNGPYGILVAWNDFTAEEEEVEERKSIEIILKEFP